MDTSQNRCPQKNSSNKLKKIIFWIIFALVVIAFLFYKDISFALKKEQVVWCHFDNMLQNPERNECLNLKIVSKQMDEVNLKQFDATGLNYSCYDSVDDLPECYGEYHYFSVYPLETLAETKDVNGFLCAEYHIMWIDNNTESINTHIENMYQYQFPDANDLRLVFASCEYRRE